MQLQASFDTESMQSLWRCFQGAMPGTGSTSCVQPECEWEWDVELTWFVQFCHNKRTINSCKIWGFQSPVGADWSLLKYDAMLIGTKLMVFHSSLLLPSFKAVHTLHAENGGSNLPWNVGNYSIYSNVSQTFPDFSLSEISEWLRISVIHRGVDTAGNVYWTSTMYSSL